MKIKFIILITIFLIIVLVILLNNDNNDNNDNNNTIKQKNLNKYLEYYIDWDDYHDTDINYKWNNMFFDGTYAIVLPKRKKNMKLFRNMLRLEIKFIDPIDKTKLDMKKLINDGIVDEKTKLNTGQVACHLSHRKVLEEFLKTKKETALIFEDDLKIPYSISNVYKIISSVMSEVPNDWEIIYFGRCWDDCQNTEKISQYLIKSLPLCRHAYAVTRSGAEKILKYTLPMVDPGDIMYRELNNNNILNEYTVVPQLFEQYREYLGTNLNNVNKLQECKKKYDQKISIIIINYKRPHNLDILLPHLNNIEIVNDIIVSHGDPDNVNNINLEKVINIEDFENQNKYFTIRRFLLSKYCKTKNILFLDDDIFPSEKDLHILWNEYVKDRINLYGPFKRLCDKQKYINTKDKYNIILTGFCLTNNIVVEKISKLLLKNSNLKFIIKNKGNGEDILFNYLFIKNFDKTPVYVDLKLNFLDNKGFHNSNKDHYKERTLLCQKLWSNK